MGRVKSLPHLGAAVVTLVAAGVTYVVGLVDGHLLDLRPEQSFCTAKPLSQANPFGGAGMFPISQKCRWNDGTTTELVPSYVNPLLFTLLALAVLFLVLAVLSRRRKSVSGEPGGAGLTPGQRATGTGLSTPPTTPENSSS
jgi:hypothetical protein